MTTDPSGVHSLEDVTPGHVNNVDMNDDNNADNEELQQVGEFDSDLVPPVDPAIPRQRIPQRGNRKRVLGNGEGDYCIYVIADGGSGVPRGALVPIDSVPRFVSLAEARRWLMASSGSLLANRQIMIFKAIEVINVAVTTVATVQLIAKVKMTVEPTVGEKP
jgi:hypothetical protein